MRLYHYLNKAPLVNDLYDVPLVGPDSGLGLRSDLQDVVTTTYVILAIEIQNFPAH